MLLKLLPLLWDLKQVKLCVCVTFKSRISVSYCPLILLDTSPTGFQILMLLVFFFLLRVSWSVEPNMGITSLIPQREPLLLMLVSQSLEVWVLTKLHLCPSYLSQCGFFFISSVQLVFSSFLEIVVHKQLFILICLWEDLSSGYSYSAILISSLPISAFSITFPSLIMTLCLTLILVITLDSLWWSRLIFLSQDL